jgi:hypothetical protein
MESRLLADLPAEDVRILLAIARRRTFGEGEVVFHRRYIRAAAALLAATA